MTSNTKTGQKPTHEVFAVKNGAEGKAYWTKIGADLKISLFFQYASS
ncbi:MAG: hypothetical protein ABSG91_09750 [Syntrophobacteraceae bacterium]